MLVWAVNPCLLQNSISILSQHSKESTHVHVLHKVAYSLCIEYWNANQIFMLLLQTDLDFDIPKE